MNVSPSSPVTFQDPFTADQVWRGIDAQLASDVRRGSVGTVGTTGSRGQARMREAFVRRSSEEAVAKVSCWAKLKAAAKTWF